MLSKLSSGIGIVTAALCAALGLRFLVVATTTPTLGGAPAPSAQPAASPVISGSGSAPLPPSVGQSVIPQNPTRPNEQALDQLLREVKRSQALSNRGPGGAADGGTADAGARLHPDLVISALPDRSEVFVDGVYVGLSPFVGTTTCRQGAELRIEMLPPRGKPRVFKRPCNGGTVRVSESSEMPNP